MVVKKRRHTIIHSTDDDDDDDDDRRIACLRTSRVDGKAWPADHQAAVANP